MSARNGSVVIAVSVGLDDALRYCIFNIRRVPFGAVCHGKIVICRTVGVVGAGCKRDGFGNRHAAVRIEERIALAVDKAKLVCVCNFLGIPFGFRDIGKVAVIGVRL